MGNFVAQQWARESNINGVVDLGRELCLVNDNGKWEITDASGREMIISTQEAISIMQGDMQILYDIVTQLMSH